MLPYQPWHVSMRGAFSLGFNSRHLLLHYSRYLAICKVGPTHIDRTNTPTLQSKGFMHLQMTSGQSDSAVRVLGEVLSLNCWSYIIELLHVDIYSGPSLSSRFCHNEQKIRNTTNITFRSFLFLEVQFSQSLSNHINGEKSIRSS